MRRSVRGLTALAAVAGLAGIAACGSSSPTGPTNVSLAGSYTLTAFSQSGVSVPGTSGTLTLTDSNYAVDITFPITTIPEVVDSGTYTATDSGAFSETSRLNGVQTTGTYSFANNVLTVNVTAQGVPISQTWQKQ